jgi:hypothetical protein
MKRGDEKWEMGDLTLNECEWRPTLNVENVNVGFEARPECFAKGTLVHTENGLVPIEQIKVGDRVLSKHESNTGEQAYKHVTKVYEHEPTRVVRLMYRYDASRESLGGGIYTTVDHPFWIENTGWTEVRKLKLRSEEAWIPTHDGKKVLNSGVKLVMATARSNVGWLSKTGDLLDEYGYEWDFESNSCPNPNVYSDEDITSYENLMKVPVWNLEVEDFHTYYVGKDGLWVHNKNSAITVINDGSPLGYVPSFFSSKELKLYLQDRNITAGCRLPTARDAAQLPWVVRGTLLDAPVGSTNAYSYTAPPVIRSSLSSNFGAGLTDWENSGTVTVNAASLQNSGPISSITLGEAAGTAGQTRLAQAFVLNSQDRFLTFTVSNLNLQNNSSADEAAPQDAFEVALLNANTGQSLWSAASSGSGSSNGTNNGTLALSNTDALLNLQRASSAQDATVQEISASVVSSDLNLDGSRTYLVDLRSIAAQSLSSKTGVAVNLSFDLIGFGNRKTGATGNVSISVGLRDVRLISSPQAMDDAASLAEDSRMRINVRANDSAAQAYQAQSGAGGSGLSNIAAVSIQVTPVNDAPVALDVSETTDEDTPAAINLIALDADNTRCELQFIIQTQPAHGTLSPNAVGSSSYASHGIYKNIGV